MLIENPMSQPAPPELSFASVARRVTAWVVLRRWVASMNTTLWPATALTCALALGAMSGIGGSITLLKAAPFLWLAGALAWAAWRRPGAYSALALWDESAGRREAFAAAWWFEQKGGALNAAARAHLDTQRTRIPQALPRLMRELPLRPARWLWLPLVLALAGGLAGKRYGEDASADNALDAAMSEAARREAEKLARSEWEKKNLEGLDAGEKEALENLKQKLQDTAHELQSGAGKSAREVMSELERRAREAERLAEKLASDKDAWASEKLIEALRRQADTADLGDAAASRDTALAAAAAGALADRLKAADLPKEARERVSGALQEAGKQSEPEDRARTLGQHVLAADEQMRKEQAQAAGAEFEKLAEKLRGMSLREQGRKELEKLAQQLREAGGNIAGQEESSAMQPMSAPGQQGRQSQSGATPQVGQAQPGQEGQGAQQPLQPPGLGQQQQSQGQPMSVMQPGQGQGQGRQMQMAQPGQPGQQGQDGAPMLLAPVPGQKPGDKPPGIIMPGGPPGDSSDQPTIMLAMPGGRDPGAGTADLNAAPTARQDSAGASVVNAQPGAEGPSSTRAVAGGIRQETAGNSATQTAVEFLAAEEAALDDTALPATRREQVRRYFNELRKRFDEAP
ncbi:MAG TPA: hypothetical protein DIT64_21865 [Verrucomicrobiales bacterium]|nr:hypothetical protein [Verrucomicrobiales bacterium]